MKTQFDHSKRVVSLENLRAMCKHASGMCHRYEVSKITRSRVHVKYSNPDEWGYSHPMTAVFPCYPGGFDNDNPDIVLDLVRVLGDNWDGEGWQAFQILLDCPQLFRSHALKWETREEIFRRLGDTPEVALYKTVYSEVDQALASIISYRAGICGKPLGDLRDAIALDVATRILSAR